MSRRTDRRRFLQSAAAAGFFLGLPPAARPLPPSERLRVGVIGVTNRAGENLRGVADAGAEVVALCDVDERRAGAARQTYPKATFDVDFRAMIDRPGIDAIVVSTPDHQHAVATVAALKSGRHVYCEKPLTHDVYEARVVAEAAKKAGKVTQMGTQIHAGDNYRRAVELVQSGAIGVVREVHVWCDRPWGGGDRPKGSDPVPQGLHWDLWLGTAPERPYHDGGSERTATYHPFYWRKYWDFGGGTLADMACHHMDLPFWALGLRHPTRVAAEGPPPHPDTAAGWTRVRYDFPARGDRPAVVLTWYDSGQRPSYFKEGKLPKWGDGTLFVGAKGMLLCDYNRRVLLPEKQYADFKAPKPTIAPSIGHHKEWVEACKSGGPTTCNFDYAGALTEAVLLGVVSYRCGEPLDWDAKQLKATNTTAAERFLRREYRKGWSL